MSTIIPNFFSINGVIDTSKSVLENMEKGKIYAEISN
jgi:hypothetical protein